MLKQNEEAKDLFEKFKFFYSNGQYKESIDILLKLAKLDNKNWDIYFRLGIIYGQNEQYKESIEALLKAIDLNPNNLNIYIGLGTSYYKNKQYR